MTLGEMVAQYRAQQANQNAQPMPAQAANRQIPVQTQQVPAQNYGLAQMLQYHPMYHNRYDLIRGAMF